MEKLIMTLSAQTEMMAKIVSAFSIIFYIKVATAGILP